MKFLISIFFVSILWILPAQTFKPYSNEFLNIGIDARALALGNAAIAQTSDVTAGYWNPANLYNVQSRQVALMHAAYFANIAQFDYMAYGNKIDDKTAFSLSLIRFGVDNIMNTTRLIDGQGNIDYDRITYFSTADYALNFSLGRKDLWKGLDLGITAKLIYRHIGDFASGYGFGFDVGAAYHTGKWNLGLVARDITTTFNYWLVNDVAFAEIQNAIPGQNQEKPDNIELTLPKLQLGIQRNFTLKNNWELSAEFDINTRFYKTFALLSSDFVSIDPALGLEFQYSKMVFLRLGVNNFQQQEFYGEKQIIFQPNAGLGFAYKGISLDYALTNIGSDGFFSHIFSLKIDLDKLLPKKQNQ